MFVIYALSCISFKGKISLICNYTRTRGLFWYFCFKRKNMPSLQQLIALICKIYALFTRFYKNLANVCNA
jgi:hypothetical protein